MAPLKRGPASGSGRTTVIPSCVVDVFVFPLCLFELKCKSRRVRVPLWESSATVGAVANLLEMEMVLGCTNPSTPPLFVAVKNSNNNRKIEIVIRLLLTLDLVPLYIVAIWEDSILFEKSIDVPRLCSVR